MKRLLMAVAAMAVAVLWAGCGDSADEVQQDVKRGADEVREGAEALTRFSATLTGAEETPNPGDPDGAGTASVNIDVDKRQVCFDVSVQRLDQPIATHIHEGEVGKAGPVVIPLTAPSSGDGSVKACTDADTGVLTRLTAQPGSFYVNVHTGRFPEGAVRGQLKA